MNEREMSAEQEIAQDLPKAIEDASQMSKETERMIQFLEGHYGPTLGDDVKYLRAPEGLEYIHQKYIDNKDTGSYEDWKAARDSAKKE